MCEGRVTSTSRCLGVHYSKAKRKFISQIQIEGRKVYLGQFDSEAAASAAYIKAKNNLHPDSYRIANLHAMGVAA